MLKQDPALLFLKQIGSNRLNLPRKIVSNMKYQKSIMFFIYLKLSKFDTYVFDYI